VRKETLVNNKTPPHPLFFVSADSKRLRGTITEVKILKDLRCFWKEADIDFMGVSENEIKGASEVRILKELLDGRDKGKILKGLTLRARRTQRGDMNRESGPRKDCSVEFKENSSKICTKCQYKDV
jgi:hypothetical protein